MKRHFTKSCTERRADEALRIVPQTKGQNGFEAWHAMQHVGKDRANDVDQFDNILRTFVYDTNKFENRLGTIRYE